MLILGSSGALLFAAVFPSFARASPVAIHSARFEQLIHQAQQVDPSYPSQGLVEKDPDKAIQLYRQALSLGEDSPDNMPHMFRLGGMLLSKDGQLEAQKDGLKLYEEILTKFDYMDYYQAFPTYSASEPQYEMVSAAIHAAETYQYLLSNGEKARPLYFHGMTMLNRTYTKRRQDWLDEPQPTPPPRFEGGRDPVGKWKLRMAQWQERQDAAKSGEVFRANQPEIETVRALVRKYGETYGRVPPETVAGLLQPIIDAFPDSPFEKEAKRIIENAGKGADATRDTIVLGGMLEAVTPMEPSIVEAAAPVQAAAKQQAAAPNPNASKQDENAAGPRSIYVYAALACVVIACIAGLIVRQVRLHAAKSGAPMP